MRRFVLTFVLALFAWANASHASLAWGSLSNFDTVNDNGVPAHGFEIEIEGIQTKDITYTYDWNHYGTHTVSQDVTAAGTPITRVRWAAKLNADGTWSAYTAVPTSNITPTNGHTFTNPAVNFGGEHFGVGYYNAATAVRYYWLVDDGAGNLVHGVQVDMGAPTWVYYPPVIDPVAQVVVAPAQVNAVLPQPEPAENEPILKEFGDATWVKIIRTKSHNNQKVELRDLASVDDANPNRKNWKNGEVDEVEVRWRIMQVDFAVGDGGINAKIENAPQDVPNGDENVTLRYEFYKYVGPLDFDSNQARATDVAADDLHGVGVRTVNHERVDLSQVVVVGDYIGAQMAGVDLGQQLGQAEHIQDGEVGVAYPERTLVIGGSLPILTTFDGALPAGMTFDTVSGILSGTPEAAGVYTFTIHSIDATDADVSTTYNLTIAAAGELLPAHFTVSTKAAPADQGSTTGDSEYVIGDQATVTATPAAGYKFVNWTEDGVELSTSASYTFTVELNHALVANFAPKPVVYTIDATAGIGGSVSGAGNFEAGSNVTVVAIGSAGYNFVNWTEGGVEVSTSPSYAFVASANRALTANFVRVTYTITVAAGLGGTASGGGTIGSGDLATVVATPAAGNSFVNWTENGVAVSALASYAFTVTGNRSLTANFTATSGKATIAVSASPSTAGSVSGGGTVNVGKSVTLGATAKSGFTFKNWTENGVIVSNTAAYTFVAQVNRTLVANFVSSAGSGGGNTGGGGGGGGATTVTLKALKLTTVASGASATFTVSLSAAAPAGGLTVSLTSSNGAVLSVPASVLVAAGTTDANFTVKAGVVAAATDVTVTAKLGTSTLSGTVRVK